MPIRQRSTARARQAAFLVALILASAPPLHAGEVLLVTEGNRLLRLDLDDPEARPEIIVENASQGGARGRDVNGMVCALPDGSGRFVAGEDTGQPDTRPGWGVFSEQGDQVAKLAGTFQVAQGEPYGCVFDDRGRLFATSVGNQGFGTPKGQLFLWFPPFTSYPGPPGAYPRTGEASRSFCKLATDLGTPSGIARDGAGRLLVASASRGSIERFAPPFPTGPDAAGGCGRVDPVGSPLADRVQRDVFFRGFYTFSGLARAPNGHLYAASVFTGEIIELDAHGEKVRDVLDPPEWIPPHATGNPMGLALDGRGRLYYADLDLRWDFPSIGPGPAGKVWRITFDAQGAPGPPEILLDGLAFPDGVTVLRTP